MDTRIQFKDCGRISYKDAWELQTKLFGRSNEQKIFNRTHKEQAQPISNYLLFCEHNHVYTLGKSGHEQNLLVQSDVLAQQGIEFFHTNRGGDITYHGPGQLTGYPILDLEQFFTDVHKYMRYLEDVIILTCAHYGVETGRVPGQTGVWVDYDKGSRARKICALGVHMGRWITMHGFGFNINSDLSKFDLIVPCGIADKGVTSLSAETGREIDMQELKSLVQHYFEEVFSATLEPYRDAVPVSGS